MGELLKQFLSYGGAGLVIGSCVGYIITPPHGAEGRYGSRWHQLRHYFENYAGTVYDVRACIPNPDGKHVRVRGLVCRQCGHVDVEDLLDDDAAVRDHIYDRSTREFVWTTHNQLEKIQ